MSAVVDVWSAAQEANKKRKSEEPEEPAAKKKSRGLRLYKKAIEDLVAAFESEHSTDEERDEAEAEILKRELLCCAIRHIALGGYKEISREYKKNFTAGTYGTFKGQCRTDREESLLDIAKCTFYGDYKSEERAEVFCTAVAEVLLGRVDAPESVTLEDLKVMPLREACGMSTEIEPQVLLGLEYDEMILDNDANVDRIVGNELKAKLGAIRTEAWLVEPLEEPEEEEEQEEEEEEQEEQEQAQEQEPEQEDIVIEDESDEEEEAEEPSAAKPKEIIVIDSDEDDEEDETSKENNPNYSKCEDGVYAELVD
jgi:hypothetical protein